MSALTEPQSCPPSSTDSSAASEMDLSSVIGTPDKREVLQIPALGKIVSNFCFLLTFLDLTKILKTIGETIGKGATATVHKALVETGQVVAVKRVDASSMSKSAFSLITAELDLLKRLSHPHIISVLGHIQVKKTLYIILECVAVKLSENTYCKDMLKTALC